MSEATSRTQGDLSPMVGWSDDCQGKKDYDGKLLVVSTRYWPAGGGFHIYDTGHPEKGLHPSNNGQPPSAHSSIILRCRETDHPAYDDCYDGIILADKDFEALTQAEVQAQVEKWVAEQFNKAARLLLEAFKS